MAQSPINSLPEVCWPALVEFRSAQLLSLLFQLEQSQYWSPEELLAKQFEQLVHVAAHARQSVPFYASRLDSEAVGRPEELCNAEAWRRLPLLTRRDVQIAGTELHSREVPDRHGRVSSSITSGSTSQPVVTLGTEITQLFWQALTLRDHFWHRRDFRESLASIRHLADNSALAPSGVQSDNWGAATQNVYSTGAGHLLNIRSSIDQQIEWLRMVAPGYLLSYPSVLASIAQSLAARGLRLPSLREVRSFGEVLEPEARETCQRVFGVKVVDMYSSQEVGYIALQCPISGDYHVQSENLLVEILDDSGKPCTPGTVGKVVVTTLHNFAMPLLRYDIGDYAEVGDSCSCGRGLPVLKRILGRQRGLIVMPDGSRRWPVFDAGERPDELPSFYQFQVIQRSRDHIDVLMVREQALLPEETERVAQYMRQTLGAPFQVNVQRVDSIARSPSGKFEDFICEIK